jgi:HK97 family phage portal protein
MTSFRNPALWLMDMIGGTSAKKVTHKTALESAPFWYGVNKISGNVGTLPLHVMREVTGGAVKAKENPWYWVLKRRPNIYQTAFVFKQTLTAQAILWGNGRAFIYRRGNDRELIPLRPDATISGMLNGEKVHLTKPCRDDRFSLIEDMEMNPEETILLNDRDVLHIQGFGDGIEGYSLVQMAKNSIAVTLGGDQRANKNMNKGFVGKIMLEVPEGSTHFRTQEQANEFLKDFETKHNADGSADAVGMLRDGIKANVLQMSNQDAQFIQQMKHQREDAALWLMLEGILGIDNAISYNSEEQKQLAYLKNCLSNWLCRWEEECAFKLLSREDQFCKFNRASLLQTDTSTTYSTFSTAITARILSPNECRQKLDMLPYEGGDSYENPAITPGETGSTSNQQAVIANLRRLMNIEQTKVNKMLAANAPFSELEKWYDKWCQKLGQEIEMMGGEWGIAQDHCIAQLEALTIEPPAKISTVGLAEQLAEKIE